MSSDAFAHDDAAYVLGALSPAQRRDFEAHLDTCESCSRSVRELAGLPGLLAGLGPEAFVDESDVPPVPDTLLPRLLGEVRRRRRRRLLLTVGAAAASVLLVASLVGALVLRHDTAPPAAAPAVQMTQVGQDRLTASVSLERAAWGTRMHLRCTYAEGWGEPTSSYALVVRTVDGRAQQVATWRALAGKETALDAATDADVADIQRVDVVVTGSGHRVLTASP